MQVVFSRDYAAILNYRLQTTRKIGSNPVYYYESELLASLVPTTSLSFSYFAVIEGHREVLI
eukprot:1226358-Amorphochlora_amoeboformis.AAC.1